MSRDPRRTAQWRKTRQAAIAVKEHECYICGRFIDSSIKSGALALEVDHVIPIALGGRAFDLDNLMLVHSICNKIKGDRLSMQRLEVKAAGAVDSALDFDDDYFDWLEEEDD